MGTMVHSLFWVTQDLYHQPYSPSRALGPKLRPGAAADLSQGKHRRYRARASSDKLLWRHENQEHGVEVSCTATTTGNASEMLPLRIKTRSVLQHQTPT